MRAKNELTGQAWLDSREKRWQDLQIATGLLPVALPLMLGSAALTCVKTNKKPVYTQQRIGKGDIPFTIYKLSTFSEHCPDGDTSTGPDDERATGFGRKLRRLGLDELPQTLNVLKGDMSVVGPRPLLGCDIERMRSFLSPEEFANWYDALTCARPGIIGTFANESRFLEPQSDEYLWTRYICDTEYRDEASRELDRRVMAGALAVGLRLNSAATTPVEVNLDDLGDAA